MLGLQPGHADLLRSPIAVPSAHLYSADALDLLDHLTRIHHTATGSQQRYKRRRVTARLALGTQDETPPWERANGASAGRVAAGAAEASPDVNRVRDDGV